MVFLPRHGRGHRISPSEINFRANIWGMKRSACTRILSVSAVGSMREDVAPATSSSSTSSSTARATGRTPSSAAARGARDVRRPGLRRAAPRVLARARESACACTTAAPT
jgi:hypothetical protein